jgi:hypothetical protein
VLAIATVGVVACMIDADISNSELIQYVGNGLACVMASATLGTFLAGCIGTLAGQMVIIIPFACRA